MARTPAGRGTVNTTPAAQPPHESFGGYAAQPAHSGLSGYETQPARPNPNGYEAVRASRDFWTLKRRFGSFVVPACAMFITWYFLYVILAIFAPGFMRVSVFGEVNVGLCFGVLQFASTFAIALSYRRWARRRLDPLSDRLRHRLEGGRR